MATQLDTDNLAQAIRAKRGELTLRSAAKEIGDVSFATLSRLEQGHVPDVDTYVQICKWLGVSTDAFIIESGKAELERPSQKVEALLRADSTLPKDIAEALIKMVNLAYTQHLRV